MDLFWRQSPETQVRSTCPCLFISVSHSHLDQLEIAPRLGCCCSDCDSMCQCGVVMRWALIRVVSDTKLQMLANFAKSTRHGRCLMERALPSSAQFCSSLQQMDNVSLLQHQCVKAQMWQQICSWKHLAIGQPMVWNHKQFHQTMWHQQNKPTASVFSWSQQSLRPSCAQVDWWWLHVLLLSWDWGLLEWPPQRQWSKCRLESGLWC